MIRKGALSASKHSCGCIVIFPPVALMENSFSHISTFPAHISHLLSFHFTYFVPSFVRFSHCHKGWVNHVRCRKCISFSFSDHFLSCEDIFHRSSSSFLLFAPLFFCFSREQHTSTSKERNRFIILPPSDELYGEMIRDRIISHNAMLIVYLFDCLTRQ